MKKEWSILRSQLNKESKTLKYHDSLHKIKRIRLFGPTEITSTRSFERLHITVIKTGYEHTNHRNVEAQLANNVMEYY
jgi:hypothetical protein